MHVLPWNPKRDMHTVKCPSFKSFIEIPPQGAAAAVLWGSAEGLPDLAARAGLPVQAPTW
jgi:hypothetical protein